MDGIPTGRDESPARSRTRAAWLLTPREEFIPESHRAYAYHDAALPLSDGQTISAPYMVTRMTAALNPGPEHRVLEVGTGSGYQAAVLSVLTPHVYTIEYVGSLAVMADTLLSALARRRPWIASIRHRSGNGYQGWEEGAPYHRILVTCAIDHIPPALLDQLAPGGILLLPLGPRNVQRLVAVRRSSGEQSGNEGIETPLEMTDVYGDGTRVVFVPFVH
jgi:protein-L-isoaspartate(D-aspartate) O-methyltransferase